MRFFLVNPLKKNLGTESGNSQFYPPAAIYENILFTILLSNLNIDIVVSMLFKQVVINILYILRFIMTERLFIANK